MPVPYQMTHHNEILFCTTLVFLLHNKIAKKYFLFKFLQFFGIFEKCGNHKSNMSNCLCPLFLFLFVAISFNKVKNIKTIGKNRKDNKRQQKGSINLS